MIDLKLGEMEYIWLALAKSEKDFSLKKDKENVDKIRRKFTLLIKEKKNELMKEINTVGTCSILFL